MRAEAERAMVWWSEAGGELLGWGNQLPGGGDRSGEGTEAEEVGTILEGRTEWGSQRRRRKWRGKCKGNRKTKWDTSVAFCMIELGVIPCHPQLHQRNPCVVIVGSLKMKSIFWSIVVYTTVVKGMTSLATLSHLIAASS